MSDWIELYSTALTERDAREQTHKTVIDAFTKLADRTAVREARPPPTATPSSPQPASSKDRSGTPNKGRVTSKAVETPTEDALSRLRTDLATTQKARSALQSQVDDLTTSISALQADKKTSTAQITQLTRYKTELERKLRDRDEELRGKSRLVEHAQDEMVALGLQLNMAEERSERLTKENKELVDRWMQRMGEEAENMNKRSNWE